MDLNSALMESITNMSEYFVAANTRTSFTELAESGPLGSSSGSVSGSVTSNSPLNLPSSVLLQQPQSQQTIQFSNQSQVKAQKINHHLDNHLQQHQSSNNQNNGNIISNSSDDNNARNTNNINNNNTSVSNSGARNSTNNLILHQSNCNSQNDTNRLINDHYQSHDCSTSMVDHNCIDLNSSNMQSTRLAQPIRNQIAIHCFIEQLDACADLPGYTSPLNDNDLFKTTNCPNVPTPKSTSSLQAISGLQNSISSQPHLPQSKLALDAVTNSCNGISNNSSSLASVTSVNSLFSETDASNNDNNDLDSVDTSIDQLPHSPLTIHQSIESISLDQHRVDHDQISGMTTILQSANELNRNFDGQQFSSAASSIHDRNHIQNCREAYAILTRNVLYIDLVRTVLLQLGYSAMDLINAKATIQIKNWKPLALDQVTDDKRATVGEVLGDISTFVTLRIRLFSLLTLSCPIPKTTFSSVTQLPTEWTETMIRQVVLALTQTMSQLTLSKLCNISQPLISSIVRGGKKLGRRKCAEFGQWYMNYIKSAEARPSNLFCEGGGARLVFDKSREIPQLKAWFATNTKPSDEMLEEYSKILNQHTLRKDRPQVTAKALKNWWKNERQKLGIRQREVRGRPKLKRVD